MATLIHLSRYLDSRPVVPVLQGVSVRTYGGDADIGTWLELRHRAFAREKVGVRLWDEADFRREFLAKEWWTPQRLWFAEAVRGASDGGRLAVGTIALAERGAGAAAFPAVHWLAVLPTWRRRGVGRLLLATLELACWQAGRRQIVLETHVGWEAAYGFYERQGYRPLSGHDPPPSSSP